MKVHFAVAIVLVLCSAVVAVPVPFSFETAVPVPGLSTGDLMLSYPTVGGSRLLVSRWINESGPARLYDTTWNAGLHEWNPPVDMGFSDWDGYATLSPDETAMFYGNLGTNYRYRSGSKVVVPLPQAWGDRVVLVGNKIYWNTASGDLWSADYSMDANVVSNAGPIDELSTTYHESRPWVTSDGKTMLFSSDRPCGYGGSNIWRSEWTGTMWGVPTALGPEINTSLNETLPSYCPATDTLYFMRREVDDSITALQATGVVPEPAPFAVVALGGMCLAALRGRRGRPRSENPHMSL